MYSLVPRSARLLLAGLCLTACTASFSPRRDSDPTWRLKPSSTHLGVKQQFILSGRNLYSVEIIAGESVSVEKGPVSPDGKTISFYLMVDSLPKHVTTDEPGQRLLQFRTLDTLVQFDLVIKGEESGG